MCTNTHTLSHIQSVTAVTIMCTNTHTLSHPKRDCSAGLGSCLGWRSLCTLVTVKWSPFVSKKWKEKSSDWTVQACNNHCSNSPLVPNWLHECSLDGLITHHLDSPQCTSSRHVLPRIVLGTSIVHVLPKTTQKTVAYLRPMYVH
jgi:hypothetical protein